MFFSSGIQIAVVAFISLAYSTAIFAPLPTGAAAPANPRNVSFWYAPASYGGADINATLAVIKSHADIITSVMVYCGHGVGPGGVIETDNQTEGWCLSPVAKGGIFPSLQQMGIGAELVLNSGTNDIKDMRALWADNKTVVPYLVNEAKRYGATGWHFDLEPQKGIPASTAADAHTYATFLSGARRSLASLGVRVTADAAAWSPMLSQYSTLCGAVDRLMDMETYSANSMTGWLDGDVYGGKYVEFVAGCQATTAAAPAIGGWNASCGKHECWSSQPTSGPPRIARMIKDGVREAAVFRLVTRPPSSVMPQEWWWPLLDQFARAPLPSS